MPKLTFRIREGKPLLDIVSYGRGGPLGSGERLTLEQVEHIRRTVRRVPEVMVKVLPRSSNALKAASNHLNYITRQGKLELEADDGERLEGLSGAAILEEWDLDIDDVRRHSTLASTCSRSPPKLVHKLMFSMPAGTPPESVLTAVRNLAREEFWGQHRYAFVLHTDEDHPHVHLVLKAVNEQGARLNIKKATLRHWRSEFARNLRSLGVPANATERAVRGETRKARRDGIYRASLRGESSHIQALMSRTKAQILSGHEAIEPGLTTLLETRAQVLEGWRSTANQLRRVGQGELADMASRFAEMMNSPRTDQQMAAALLSDRGRDAGRRNSSRSSNESANDVSDRSRSDNARH